MVHVFVKNRQSTTATPAAGHHRGAGAGTGTAHHAPAPNADHAYGAPAGHVLGDGHQGPR